VPMSRQQASLRRSKWYPAKRPQATSETVQRHRVELLSIRVLQYFGSAQDSSKLDSP